jgi:hypothetical protein
MAIFVVRCSDTIPAQNCINTLAFELDMAFA